MCEGLEARREDLGGINVCCRVGAEIEEELEESEEDDEGDFAECVELAGENSEEEGAGEETLDLDPFATEPFDGECRDIVALKHFRNEVRP